MPVLFYVSIVLCQYCAQADNEFLSVCLLLSMLGY